MTSLRAWWAQRAAELDTVPAATMPIHVLRLTATIGTAALALLILPAPIVGGWSATMLAAEAAVWFAGRPPASPTASRAAQRWRYVAAILFMNGLWWSLTSLIWLQGSEGAHLAACFLIFAMLIHGVSLVSGSQIMMMIVLGGPAVLAIALPARWDHFAGADRVLVLGAATISLAYILKAAITGAKRNLDLEAALKAADAANRAKSAFLAETSHELRTPLAGMLGMARALAHPVGPEQAAERLRLLVRSGEGLMVLLNDLLDLSKVEAGRLDLEFTAFDLAEQVTHVEALWSEAAASKGLRLSCDTQPQGPVWLSGDPTRIRQVLNNLVSNAVKFTERGEVRLTTRVSPADNLGHATVTLVVADTGIGLSPQQQAGLFEPYRQADPSIARVYGGSGLGLSIARRIARAMGGDITLDSTLGAGAVFTVSLRLPYASAPDQQAEASASIDPDAASILVVDDNPANRLFATVTLEALGCRAVAVHSGEAALDHLRLETFDAVLMDVHMPGMGGEEAVAAIRAGQAGRVDIPIIALTADVYPQAQARLLAAGFDAVEAKPIALEALAARLVQAIGARSGETGPVPHAGAAESP